jgi:hypothetical protein
MKINFKELSPDLYTLLLHNTDSTVWLDLLSEEDLKTLRKELFILVDIITCQIKDNE